MSILSDDIMNDSPAMELYMLLMTFDKDPHSTDSKNAIFEWANKNLQRSCKRFCWRKYSYLGICMDPEWPNRVVVAGQFIPHKTTYWRRTVGQRNTTRGWRTKVFTVRDKPVISSSFYNCQLTHGWELPKEIFEELYNLMKGYGNTI